MSNFNSIVYLTEEQYLQLKTNGTLTVGDVTINFDESTLYVTDEDAKYIKETDFDLSVVESLTNNSIDLTAEQKTAAQSWLGITAGKTIKSKVLTADNFISFINSKLADDTLHSVKLSIGGAYDIDGGYTYIWHLKTDGSINYSAQDSDTVLYNNKDYIFTPTGNNNISCNTYQRHMTYIGGDIYISRIEITSDCYFKYNRVSSTQLQSSINNGNLTITAYYWE